MKKVLSCLLAVLLLASLCVTAVAAAPVPSVEAEPRVPVVLEATDDDGNDVAAAIIITDYEDKEAVEKLSEEAQEKLEAAAESLKDLDALIEGNDDLKELLAGAEVDGESLFDISIVGDVKLPVNLKLELDNPDNFAALLHFVDDGVEVIDTTLETEEDEEVLSMVLEEVGSYAVLSFVDAEE